MTAFDFDSIDRESLLHGADAFFDKEEAEDYLDDRIRNLEQLDPVVTLYRVVMLESLDDLNINALGNHWTDDESILDDHLVNYLKYECNGEEIPGEPYLLKADFDSSCIDIKMTLAQNLLNPHEHELFIADQKLAGPVFIKPHSAERYARFNKFDFSCEHSISP